MSNLRIGVFGCKTTSAFLASHLHRQHGLDAVITIAPDSARKADVADYCDLRPLCAVSGIPVHEAARYSLKCETDVQAIAAMRLDVGFVIGWQRLVPADVLRCFPIGVFGMHGSTDDLPIGRGRSPMNWALLERRQFFHTNLFRYDPGVDSGDILDTFTFSIQAADTAETMHYKNLLAMKLLIDRNLPQFGKGPLQLRRQRDTEPTYYPKRDPDDSLIDWRQDIFQIEAHARAVARPFNGAFTFLGDHRMTIWRCAIFETDLVDYGYRTRPAGEILEVFPSAKFLVRCRGGLLLVHEYESAGEIRPGAVLQSPTDRIRTFPRNACGYFDAKPTDAATGQRP